MKQRWDFLNLESLILVGVILAFFIIGVVFSFGKGAFLVAGFNTMSAEEKEKYNSIALCKFMGKMMFSLCASMVFWVVAVVYNEDSLFIIGLILFMMIIISGLIYMNIGNRFIKNTLNK